MNDFRLGVVEFEVLTLFFMYSPTSPFLPSSYRQEPLFRENDRTPEHFNTGQNMGTDAMSTCCLRTKCNRCCRHTNMLLTARDIATITSLGYNRTYFVEERNSWLQLKNAHGRCVFHTGERCSIYDHRPEGCMLYPVVYDADLRCAILDSECPQQHQFFLGKRNVRKLMVLIETLQYERSQRENTRRYLKRNRHNHTNSC